MPIVESSLNITYINIEAPDLRNDALVYERYTRCGALQDKVYSERRLTFNDICVPAYLVVDLALPLSKNLMKPFVERVNMPVDQFLLSCCLSHCGSRVERAFGHRKNRFRTIYKQIEYNVEHAKATVKTMCILYKIYVSTVKMQSR